jgi:hypothetical protein
MTSHFLLFAGQKAKNVVTIEVDGVFGSPGAGEAGVSRTDTNDPFYMGGVPGKKESHHINVDSKQVTE